MFVDSHCHLDFPGLAENIDQILARMSQARVDTALCVSVTLQDFPRVLALARNHHLWASVGVHPDYPDIDEPTVDQLVTLSADELYKQADDALYRAKQAGRNRVELHEKPETEGLTPEERDALQR